MTDCVIHTNASRAINRKRNHKELFITHSVNTLLSLHKLLKGKHPMKKYSFLSSYLTILSSLLIISCASTKLTSTWNNDAYDGIAFKKILIIGVSQKPALRALYENEFAATLKGRGTDAFPSHTLIPSDKMLDRDTIVESIGGRGMDAVLITSATAVKRYTSPPGYRNSYYNDYAERYTYLISGDEVTLETKLYDTRTEGLVWSAVSNTYIDGSDKSVIQSIIRAVVDRLSEEQLIQ